MSEMSYAQCYHSTLTSASPRAMTPQRYYMVMTHKIVLTNGNKLVALLYSARAIIANPLDTLIDIQGVSANLRLVLKIRAMRVESAHYFKKSREKGIFFFFDFAKPGN